MSATTRITGTEYRARTLYRSTDGSVREFAILDAEGATLGRVSYHGARLARARGYHEGTGAWDHRKPSWPTLAAAAAALAARRAAATPCAVEGCTEPATGSWDVIARPTTYLGVPLCDEHVREHRADEHVREMRPAAAARSI